VLTADLSAELDRAARGLDLPSASASGTWRPGGAPGEYASSLPFRLAQLAGQAPLDLAEALAARLAADWIAAATVTGGGYLHVTVTPAALAGVAPRVVGAGPACARSTALAGMARTAPPLPDPAAARSWDEAVRAQARALTGRLAGAAGATMTFQPERPTPTSHTAALGPSPVAVAVAWAGADAVRYLLARARTGRAGETGWRDCVRQEITNPYYAVSFARADAASVLRWAAKLDVARGGPGRGQAAGLGVARGGPGRGQAGEPGIGGGEADQLASHLSHPRERALLALLSWLPERVAAAARRNRPDELPRYLEQAAAGWLDCRESCPALPFGGRDAPGDAAGMSARLWLADAVRTVLGTGLGLLGITPPGGPAGAAGAAGEAAGPVTGLAGLCQSAG
jgi:arginyl-tRNA synthetase